MSWDAALQQESFPKLSILISLEVNPCSNPPSCFAHSFIPSALAQCQPVVLLYSRIRTVLLLSQWKSSNSYLGSGRVSKTYPISIINPSCCSSRECIRRQLQVHVYQWAEKVIVKSASERKWIRRIDSSQKNQSKVNANRLCKVKFTSHRDQLEIVPFIQGQPPVPPSCPHTIFRSRLQAHQSNCGAPEHTFFLRKECTTR